MSLIEEFPPGTLVICDSKKYTIKGISVKNTACFDAVNELGQEFEIHNCFCKKVETTLEENKDMFIENKNMFHEIKKLIELIKTQTKSTNGPEYTKALVDAQIALKSLSKFY